MSVFQNLDDSNYIQQALQNVWETIKLDIVTHTILTLTLVFTFNLFLRHPLLHLLLFY